ncbi:protein enabled homolog [Paramacrobiotus metropolitanus]|uniref:protein enabled homolog n=1 Tax=Paramacrobiotus metropolitanus TaxID=2943436 RepID=UPI002445AF23|nr:protein enabled homolog [Paramacrobiotus metropolitanus]
MEEVKATAHASVLVYNPVKKRWLPAASSSQNATAKVHVFQHRLHSTFRVVGRHLMDYELVINCAIVNTGCKYIRATPTFHQLHDGGLVYGLSFLTKEEANIFATAMGEAIQALNVALHKRSIPGIQPRIRFLSGPSPARTYTVDARTRKRPVLPEEDGQLAVTEDPTTKSPTVAASIDLPPFDRNVKHAVLLERESAMQLDFNRAEEDTADSGNDWFDDSSVTRPNDSAVSPTCETGNPENTHTSFDSQSRNRSSESIGIARPKYITLRNEISNTSEPGHAPMENEFLEPAQAQVSLPPIATIEYAVQSTKIGHQLEPGAGSLLEGRHNVELEKGPVKRGRPPIHPDGDTCPRCGKHFPNRSNRNRHWLKVDCTKKKQTTRNC